MKFDDFIEYNNDPDLICFFIWFGCPRYAGLLTEVLAPGGGVIGRFVTLGKC